MTYAASPLPGSKVIIVGGGAFGLSTAYTLSLADKNFEIWVFDRYEIPCPDAASTDISKCVRMDYGNDPLYMNLMLEAFPIWRQWNDERAADGDSPVFHETGFLCFGQNGQFSDAEVGSLENIRKAGYGHTVKEFTEPEKLIEAFPQFKDAVSNGYNIAYFNKQGGWCNSAETIKHLHRKCMRNGVHFVTGSSAGTFERLYCRDTGEDDVGASKEVLGIQTTDGKIHCGDLVIMTAGSWTASLIDTGGLLRATGQIVVHFKLPENIHEQLKDMPPWAGDWSKTGFYGFPPTADGILKVASHSWGYLNPRKQDGVSVPRTRQTNPSDTIPKKALREMRSFLQDFFPYTSQLDIVYARTCWYSDTPTADFLIDCHPRYRNLIVASGDSGHAMKFVPIIGSKIVDTIEGIESDYSRRWAWRNVTPSDPVLPPRGGVGEPQQPSLSDGEESEVRMVTLEELKAQNPG